MASALDMLLGESAAKLSERPEKEMEIKRLTGIFRKPFVVKLRGLTMRELDDLPKGEDFKTLVVIKGAVEPDLTSQALAEKLRPQGRKTPLLPPEVASALFLPGEIMALYNAVTELSGFGDTAVEEIKKIDADGELMLVAWLFWEHYMRPGEYYALPRGEKLLIRAIVEKKLEEVRERG